MLDRLFAKIDKFMERATWYGLGFMALYVGAQIIRAFVR
jgi:hypothetical protein